MIYIIDSAVILNDELFYFDEAKKYVTTYRVSLEIKDFRSKSLLNNAIKNSILQIMEPSEESIKGIENLAKKYGTKLSEADVSLVSLAADLKEKKEKITVITDDYSVQNLLLKLQISFQSVIRGEIKKFKNFK